MDTKRCTYCQKLSRTKAETCSQCGHPYAENESKVILLPPGKGKRSRNTRTRVPESSEGRAAPPMDAGRNASLHGKDTLSGRQVSSGYPGREASLEDGQKPSRSLVSIQQRSIPPASPHRAGHYSGLHPEDQPYQSSIMLVQRPPAPEQPLASPRNTRVLVQQANKTVVQAGRGQAIAPAPHVENSAIHHRDDDSALPHVESSAVHHRDDGLSSHDVSLQVMPLLALPSPIHHYPPKKPFLRERFVPITLTLSCLILLVASSLLAYIYIHKSSIPARQILNVQPDQVRVKDTFTLSGRGFGTNDLITFTHDQDNAPLLDGNGQPLQTHADDVGTFAVQVVVPINWAVGQHTIFAFDIGREQSLSIVATLTVLQSSSAPSLLQLSTARIDLGTDVPGAVSKENMTLINAGGRQLLWQASSDQSWLTVSPNSGAFSGETSVAVTANRGALLPQNYEGHITFRQQGSSDIPLTLTVTMTVKSAPPASLIVAPVTLTYSGTPTQNPANQSITLQNNGSQPMNWSSTIGNNAAWLSIHPSSDNLGAHASETVTVSVQSQQLAVGSYQGTLNFKGGVNPQVTVALYVAAPGNLIVSPPSLNFSSPGQNPAGQIITVQNSGGAPVDWTAAAATVDGANWLNPTPSSGHLEPNQATNVTVNVNAAALKPRSYQGTLTFTYGGLTNQVAVSLTVSVPPSPAIGLDTNTLNFSTLKGTNPVPQAFKITNTGNATLNWAIAESQNGATFAPTSSITGSLAPTQSAVITVTPNVLQVSAATLTTTITVSSRDGKVASQSITVNVVIREQAIINLSTSMMAFSHNNGIIDSSQSLDIKNTGSITLNWIAQPSDSWLYVDVTSGTIDPGSDQLINVHCNSSALAPGTYTASLVISDSDAGTPTAPQTLIVTVVVS